VTTGTFRSSKLSGLIVLLIIIGIGGVFTYWRTRVETVPGEYEVRKGNYRLEDGLYEDAEREFSLALERNAELVGAHHGLGVTYLQMGRLEDALEKFTAAVTIDPSYAVGYADRGITYDRMGRYEEALGDYRKSLEIDAEVVEGPGWLWRFLRNVQEKPPTIRERAEYLEAELKKPPGERLLTVPERDQEQLMYKK
jgi:tetratricopeptide (TPR) repeat protein